MRTRTLLVGVLSLLAAAIAVAAAAAARPVATPFNDTSTAVETDLCTFPVTIQSTIAGTLTTFTDANGVRASLHATEVDVLSANGKSLMSLPYTIELFAPVESDGSFGPITGVAVFEKVPLPDGSLFISAGHDVRIRTTAVSIPQRGATVNLAGLCAALSP